MINSLPPELLSSIIDLASQCDATFDSYRRRIDTLSSLTLVNHYLHELAQPRLGRILYLRSTKARQQTGGLSGRLEFVVVDEAKRAHHSEYVINDLSRFSFVRELRSVAAVSFDLFALHDHKHLTRLAIEEASFLLDERSEGFCLPNLLELSLDQVIMSPELKDRAWQGGRSSFLSTSRFPSLRALGATRFHQHHWNTQARQWTGVPTPVDFISQLECLVKDKWLDELDSFPASLPSPLVLYDLDPGHTTTSWGRSSILPDAAALQRFLRIRLRCEPIAHRLEIEAILFLVETLLHESTHLERLYLDLYPREGRRGYRLDEELEERIRKLLDPKRKTKVEIVWENHEDDFIRSRVSREFWKRCKEEKEKEQRGNDEV